MQTARVLQATFRELLSSLHIESLIEGNMTAAEAESLLGVVRKSFSGQSLPITERPVDQVAHIPPGSAFLIR